jgi:PAS domain S-box-containing protein
MTRPSFRLPVVEGLAVLGVFFGAWLIQNAFQPLADLPNPALFLVGGVDILLCFGLLGWLLRQRLSDGQPIPRGWIAGGVVLVGCFLGWIAALFIDADRLRIEEQQLHSYDRDLGKLLDSLHHLAGAVPTHDDSVNPQAWLVNHGNYVQLHGALAATLHARPAWDKELTRIDEQVQQMQRTYDSLLESMAAGPRAKARADYQQARSAAIHQIDALRAEITQNAQDQAATQHARWQGVGAAALTGVVLILGCVLMWLVFDRALRRSWKANARLSDSETRFRSLVENQAEPIAVIDGGAIVVYANPAWKTAFGYELDELLGANLLELVHADDRLRVRALLQSSQTPAPIPCRLSADYGVWHDVELVCQAHTGADLTAVRVRDVRETPEMPIVPHAEMLHDPAPVEDLTPKLQTAGTRIAELEAECRSLRERAAQATDEVRHHRWLLGSHKDAGNEGVLILSDGKALSWNPAFVQMWKLSDETMAGHSWQTIAAHMETLAQAGWDDFRRAADGKADNVWEMTLEGGKLLEVYAQVLPDHPQNGPAIRFHFRDVTRQQELETTVRDHQEQVGQLQKRLGEQEEHKKTYAANLREHEKRLKHLEKQLRERDQNREELETTLRDHQDRLHQMHEAHESHATALKVSKEATRRLASGVANDFNNVLSVVMGNTDVLRENLPKDHMAQNYVDEIRQAANRGAELSQRLLAFSRNHLLQMTPVDINQQLAALEPKIRTALGHDVQLQWEHASEELWVKTDPHPLEQALLHLVTHAKGHMPTGGTLTLRASRVQLTRKDLTHADMAPGAYIQLTLQDTGNGIDDESLPHVFEPYHPVTEGQKGDLTLATAYGIMRQSGGCIDVASQKGHSCEWTILLPETQERPQHAAA